jgi:hypothetical protein
MAKGGSRRGGASHRGGGDLGWLRGWLEVDGGNSGIVELGDGWSGCSSSWQHQVVGMAASGARSSARSRGERRQDGVEEK